MFAFTKRNILLYFRDKMSIFFSLLAVIILIALYVFFLGDLTSKNLPDFPSKKPLLNFWFLAGVLAITSMTTTLGSFGILVEDRVNKRYMDFYVSPISRTKLVGGYITSALFIGFCMCLLTLIVANTFFFFSGEPVIEWSKMLLLFGVILLSVASSGALILFVVSFFKTSNAFAAASTVIGTLLGFLAGIYIPIGTLPDYIQTVIKLFPLSHATSLFRQVLMESALIHAFTDAPTEMQHTFMTNMGIHYEMNDKVLNSRWSVYYLICTTIFFLLLYFFTFRKKSAT